MFLSARLSDGDALIVAVILAAPWVIYFGWVMKP
jgi:hypothetical protein